MPVAASLIWAAQVGASVTGCDCGGERSSARFGPYMVDSCFLCHRLKVDPVVDPRVPSFQEHVQALREEIGVEEEEGGKGKELKVVVESAASLPEGAKLRVQCVGGKPSWLVKGSRVEAYEADRVKDEEAVVAIVSQKAGTVLELLAERVAWRDLRPGFQLLLRPQTNATIQRTLLQAFLLVKRRWGDGYAMAERPLDLPRISFAPVAGLDDAGLREGQAKALRACVNLKEGGVALIHGPPGTGKTTVIARLIAHEARRHRRVLVASHTHVAIDNALRKALRHTPALAAHVLRLGDGERVAADMHELRKRVGEFHPDPEDPEARPLFESIQDRAVVGMTLDALASALLSADQTNQEVRLFDTVIVDEAGMNGFPKIALAAAVAKRLVLVGDPLQLPPIVRAWSFRNDVNYKRSHFEVLGMMRPDLSVLLDEQFRCQPAIYQWSQDAVYGGQVHSAAPRKLLPLAKLLGQPVLSPVVWVDTSTVPGNQSEMAGGSRINPTHTALALKLILEMMKQKVAPEDIGYISPFRAQAEAFREAVEAGKAKLAPLAKLTASTVDAFQGNERRAILLDLTTLAPAKPHEDHRRLNVSLTRAQELLVILGPRPFVRSARENPFMWSLQNWKAAQTVQASAP